MDQPSAPAPQSAEAPVEQQQNSQNTGPAPQIASNGLGPMDLPQIPNPNLMDPEAMAAILPTQPFIPDPSMMAIPMPDPQMMAMPLMMANGNTPGAPAQPKEISADDIALYDRQIRLWGVAAQAKIQSANVLLITMRALANEIAKNLVLAGIGSLTILDDTVVTEADLGAQFFLSGVENPVGQNRAAAAHPAVQKLNPRVQVHIDADGVKSKGPSYFAGFDVVIATDLDSDSFNLINTATRLNGRKFYGASTHGMYGFLFSDLIEHDYVIEREVGNIATQPKQETRTRSIIDVKTRKEGTKNMESVTKRELFSTWFLASDMAGLPEEYTKSKRRLKSVTPALSCLRALWEFMQVKGGQVPSNREDLKMFTQIATQKHKALGLPSETLSSEFLRSFLQNLGSEIAPVSAILGGQLAQDVINVLGQKEQPIQNMIILDGNTMESLMYPLHPEGALGTLQLSLASNEPLIPNGGAGGDVMMGVGMDGIPFDPTAMAAMPIPDGFPMGGAMIPPGISMPIIPGQILPVLGQQPTNGTGEQLPTADASIATGGPAGTAPPSQPSATPNASSTQGETEPPKESST
uniref:Ubiquitin-like 1-activating enzyme E1A n=1 Tax=Bionectria ochroleuca TaxID=29856 RepID=A0A8H7K8S8_BIOOC